jgi:hypothetical protein
MDFSVAVSYISLSSYGVQLRWQNINPMVCCKVLYETAIIMAFLLSHNAFCNNIPFSPVIYEQRNHCIIPIFSMEKACARPRLEKVSGQEDRQRGHWTGVRPWKDRRPNWASRAHTQHSTRLPSFIPNYRRSSSALSIPTTKFPKCPRTINSLHSKSKSDQWNLTLCCFFWFASKH